MEKGKKRNQKLETERRNKSYRRKKEKKERDLMLTLVMWVLKLELSHLMRETSCTSFIGGA